MVLIKGSERGPKALNEPNVLINLSSLFLEKGFATHNQKILEFLFFFVHPFLYLLFFKNRRQFKNIGMNYLTTRDFDT